MNNALRMFRVAKLHYKCNHFKLLRGPASCTSVHMELTTRNYVSKQELNPYSKPEGFVNNMISKILFYTVAKSKLKVTGYILVQSVVDGIDYFKIIQKLNLPDTFYSWFVITELYVWMIMVRYMAEGESGRLVRNSVLEAMWVDVRHRAKKLGAANPGAVRQTISEFSSQLNAALIAYDEGLQSSDTVLAGALWRRLFQQEEVDPEHLDALVKYIRRQIRILDNMPHDELFKERKINWEPFVP